MPRTLHICGLIKDDALALQVKGIALRMGWQFSHSHSPEEFNFSLSRITPTPNLLILERFDEDLLQRYHSMARVVLEEAHLTDDPDIIFLPKDSLGDGNRHSGALVKAITSAANLMRVRSLLQKHQESDTSGLVWHDLAERLTTEIKRAGRDATDTQTESAESTADEGNAQGFPPPVTEGGQVGVLCLGVDHATELFQGIDETMQDIGNAILNRTRKIIEAHYQAYPIPGGVANSFQLGFHSNYNLIALLPGLRQQSLESLAQTLLEGYRKPLACGQTTAYLSVSIGLLVATDTTHPERALALVEHAMTEASREGGNRLNWAQQDLDLMSRIPLALEREEFSVCFQPQWRFKDSRLTGAEALLRWHGMDIGEIQPDRFIRLAESAGTMQSLGNLVIRKACQQAASWLEQLICPIVLSLNLSPLQLRSGDLVHLLQQMIEQHGLNPHDLELEIDYADFQTLWREEPNEFHQLKALGVGFALDKVGTSLIDALALKSWPVSTIKLNRELIQRISTDPQAARMTAQLIGLSRTLGIRTVAMGVEDQETHILLNDLGCDCAQGHFYCTALPAMEFAALLRNNMRNQIDDES